MTLVPVIVRELRAQSRQPLTYWLRVLAAGAVLAMFGLLVLRLESWERTMNIRGFSGIGRGVNPFSNFGAMLFGQLNATLFVCNALLAPLLTADCISREKREGTLGLLFLTRLSAAGIVSGKGFVHTLRGLMLFIAMVPVLAVPVLLGGVSAKDCAMALLIDGTVLVLGLSAGILASAVSRDWTRSVVLAELLSVALVITFMYGHVEMLTRLVTGRLGFPYSGHSLLDEFVELFCFHTNFAQEWGGWGAYRLQTAWSYTWSSAPNIQAEWFALMTLCLLSALVFFGIAIAFTAWRVRRTWRQEPASRKVTELQQTMTRPRFGVGFLRRRLSRSLNRNPIGWLQSYSWSGRITKWGWFGAIVIVESFIIADLWDFAEAQPWLILALLAGLAFTASASFRKERENGALELLLVCPLSERQFIWGRLRGIWSQFLPSFALLYLCIRTGGQIEGHYTQEDFLVMFGVVTSAFLTIPVIGLFLSLRTANFLTGWLWTVFLGIVVPILLFNTTGPDPRLGACAQWITAAVCWILLYDNLKHRRFRFNPG